MKRVTFADVVVQALSFSSDHPAFDLIIALINSSWMQRLREIHQTANTRLVYMFSEHSRFGHSLGVGYLADLTMRNLLSKSDISLARQDEVRYYWPMVTIAALLHDIGHLAPGSHLAFRAWFPNEDDSHEILSEKIILDSAGIKHEVPKLTDEMIEIIVKILKHDDLLPAWTWECISGGGWNVDRGNWCVADSVMAGVAYGKYNIEAIIESLTIDEFGHLALRENRLDAMMHFAVSRHAMYRQLYQHRVLLAADALMCAVVDRAKSVERDLRWSDETMDSVLSVSSSSELSLDMIFAMREPWWRYHLFRWQSSKDIVLADLAERLLNRRLLKTVRLPSEPKQREDLLETAQKISTSLGYDPKYYLHIVKTRSVAERVSKGMLHVIRDDGNTALLSECDPLFSALAESVEREWLAMPEDVKYKLTND
jgi:HD superfamily phosphohydrolase